MRDKHGNTYEMALELFKSIEGKKIRGSWWSGLSPEFYLVIPDSLIWVEDIHRGISGWYFSVLERNREIEGCGLFCASDKWIVYVDMDAELESL